MTSIEDVTVAASEGEETTGDGEGCSTPCPVAAVAEFMPPEDCQAPCPLQDEPDQDDAIGESTKVARRQNLIPSFPWIAPGWRA